MSSSVFYKFKSQKEASRVEFDGTGISVFELKRDIIIKSGLGDGTDFDLAIFNEDGKEEYDDDTAIIPRSTSVIARRLPAMKKGAGRAQRYMTGKMPINAKNSSRKEQTRSTAKVVPAASAPMDSAMTEEQRMALMFQQSSEQWSSQLDEMSKLAKVPINYPNKKHNTESNEPPLGYICYRCGEKGHWIKECPTNDDPNWENKPRIKRTTGIPRSFLKTVEKPSLTGDGSEDTKPPSGIMVNAEGQFVIAEPDKASWEQFQAKTKSSAAAQKAAALGDKELQDRGLECSIDKRIFIDPMKTPCCEKTYCNECITNALIESDFTCPGCQTEGVLIDDLKHDDEMSLKIKEYLEEKNAAVKARSQSPSVKPESTTPPPVPAASEIGETKKIKSTSPSPKSPVSQSTKSSTPPTLNATSSSTTTTVAGNPKKRPANELLENPKIPKGPKAMQQQESQKQTLLQQQQQQQMLNTMNTMNGMNGMNGMSGFPNMFNMATPNFYGAGAGFNPMQNNMMNMNMNMNGFTNPMLMNPMMNMYGMGMMNGGMGMPMMNGGANGQVNGNGNDHTNGMGMGMNNGPVNGNGMGHNMNSGIQPGQFSNQQKTIFAEPLPNEEDNAYFRKPVNPHRHQGRQRRARPSDYREL